MNFSFAIAGLSLVDKWKNCVLFDILGPVLRLLLPPRDDAPVVFVVAAHYPPRVIIIGRAIAKVRAREYHPRRGAASVAALVHSTAIITSPIIRPPSSRSDRTTSRVYDAGLREGRVGG